MKALTLQQPWASLIAVGAKCIETRGWHPAENPGVIAIASSKKPMSKRWREACDTEPFASALHRGGLDPDDLPRGSFVAVVKVTSFERTDELFVHAPERHFGDFSPGRWAWHLSCVQQLEEPILIPPDPPDRKVFRLNLWDIPPEQVRGELSRAAVMAGRSR